MAKKLDHRFWAKYFRVYDVLNMVIPYQELLDTVVKELDIKKGDLILDAGCGTGNLAMKMKAKGAKVIGVDYSIEALDVYRQKDPDAECLVHDLTKSLPFPDNYFDKVTSNNVIYALPIEFRQKTISELYRVLKKGGNIVVVNPIKTNPENIYFEHIRKRLILSGYYGLIKDLFVQLVPTLKMFFYNFKIIKKLGTSFPSIDDKKNLFLKAGFAITGIIPVYADESIALIGNK